MSTKNTSNTETTTINDIIKGAFYHAINSCLNAENEEAARTLANAFNAECLGNAGEVPEGSRLMIFAKGFVLGLNEGLKVAEAKND